jgi:guanylate kinase
MSSNPIHTGKAIIFSAPSGAGKTTIVHHILQQNLGLEFSISATSRPKRTVERAGKDYHYFSVEEFRKKISADEFIEWEQVYHDQYYGTLRSEVERIWNNHKHCIFDVDVEGGLNLKSHFGDRALAIFVKPPTLESLAERLRGRNTETEESLKRRLDKAGLEMAYADRFDEVLINDDLSTACKQAEHLIRKFLAS